MSILLDALKKSEEQRQLGRPPTIHSSVEEPPGGGALIRHWVPVSLMGLSVLVMAWFGWQQFRQPEAGSDKPAQVTQADVRSVQATPDGASQESAPEPATPAQGGREQEQRTPVESFEPKDQTSSAVSSLQAQNNEEPGDTDENAVAAAAPSQPQVSLTQTVDAAQQDSQSVSQEEQQAAAQYAIQEAQQTSQSITQEPQPGRSQMQPYLTEPISYWEIPQGVRDNLPEFRITVLVYADRPEDRFLLLNGQRMAEEDELQDGLVLDEIRRDGAVFRYRNYLFLVKG